MKESSTADRAVRLVAKLEEAEAKVKPFIDFGEATGFCDEWDRLYRDVDAALGSLTQRALLLIRRVDKHVASAATAPHHTHAEGGK